MAWTGIIQIKRIWKAIKAHKKYPSLVEVNTYILLEHRDKNDVRKYIIMKISKLP